MLAAVMAAVAVYIAARGGSTSDDKTNMPIITAGNDEANLLIATSVQPHVYEVYDVDDDMPKPFANIAPESLEYEPCDEETRPGPSLTPAEEKTPQRHPRTI